MPRITFASRHIGISEKELPEMLKTVGLKSLDELIKQTIPASIRLKKEIDLPEAQTENQYLRELKTISLNNKVYKSYIGLGYYDTVVPGVIQRNILENPGWYTAYTPYQAEISQGRLEALLNYQTMIVDLTGLEIANASLLDEATAAAEAMHVFHASRNREQQQRNANKLFVSDECFPQTIAVLETRANPLGIEVVVGDWKKVKWNDGPPPTPASGGDEESPFFGAIIQYPAKNGEVHDYKSFTEEAHRYGVQVGVASDLMALVMLTPPGEWGADIVFGNSQRFGVPLGYGGPHAAFFTAKEIYKREMPGRIIGVSIDQQGNRALRMALQTREQHIRRDKATSNICTAQVLLAVMAGMYAVYHGPQGIKYISTKIHEQARLTEAVLSHLGYKQLNKVYFDTLTIAVSDSKQVIDKAAEKQVNLRKIDDKHVAISLDEATDKYDLKKLFDVFAEANGKKINEEEISNIRDKRRDVITGVIQRKSEILSHPVFSMHHSETEMLRYIASLEKKDLSLNFSMIPLGSCTMKLNATSEMAPVSWPEWNSIHPFVPVEQAQGYAQIIRELEEYLASITGFSAVSLQPNSGAQGEYAGLLVIRQYHISRGDTQRNVALIPQSAHGTNPASAVMAGMKVVVVKTDDYGNIDINDLRQKAEQNKDNLSCLMVTYPSTFGVYEEGISEVTSIVHQYGGQVYMDGANMNAQVGLTNPANIGADVCHLNLHKTFAIPHGGGGPGMGPIGVAKHLAPFLPGHPLMQTGGQKGVNAVSAAPWGSASILLISYAYIKMLGKEGTTDSTKYAILNANYLKSQLENHYPVLYQGANGRVAHEMILDCRSFKNAGVEVEDIAKRLMDYGFHAPTISFPVAGTMMIEPTESESKAELDRFCDAMIAIREEIAEIEKGMADKKDNVLKNAPHTLQEICKDEWTHAYSRQQAAFPLPYLREKKFWASVSRVENAYGDRNLMCVCPPIEEYEKSDAIIQT